MKEIRDRYEIFLKVCETGSFSKAAEALSYTQSGISQMMAGFEEELGVQLFARAKKGVTLTDNGRMLMPYIQEMANQKDKLRQAAFNINHKIEGKLRIGSFSIFLMKIIRRLKCRFLMETMMKSETGLFMDRWTADFCHLLLRMI